MHSPNPYSKRASAAPGAPKQASAQQQARLATSQSSARPPKQKQQQQQQSTASSGARDDDDEEALEQLEEDSTQGSLPSEVMENIRALEEDRGRLEEELRASREERAQMAALMAQMRQQLQAQQQTQQQQLPHNAAPSVSPTPSPGAQATTAQSEWPLQRAERKQLTLVQPARLTYERACEARELEDWIFGVEQMFEQLRFAQTAPFDAPKITEARLLMDRDLNLWWEGQEQQSRSDGAPIDTWTGFVQALRAQFVPETEKRQAITELINIRQAAGESMNSYFQRAMRLFVRARNFDDGAAMRIVLERVRKEEWRFAYAAAVREVERGGVTSLAQLRAFLQREAIAEPSKLQQGGQSATQQRVGPPSSKSTSYRKPAVRAAAIGGAGVEAKEDATEEQEGEEGGTAPGGVQVAAAGQRPVGGAPFGGRCARCRSGDHRVADCKQPDKRTCYVCDEVGHISKDCPRRAAKSSSAPKPKNL